MQRHAPRTSAGFRRCSALATGRAGSGRGTPVAARRMVKADSVCRMALKWSSNLNCRRTLRPVEKLQNINPKTLTSALPAWRGHSSFGQPAAAPCSSQPCRHPRTQARDRTRAGGPGGSADGGAGARCSRNASLACACAFACMQDTGRGGPGGGTGTGGSSQAGLHRPVPPARLAADATAAGGSAAAAACGSAAAARWRI